MPTTDPCVYEELERVVIIALVTDAMDFRTLTNIF
jgi:hypothetical protein